jgi:hypothetical protein
MVRCWPVNAPANRAPRKATLAGVNIGRHQYLYHFLGPRLQNRVALQTARKQPVTRFQATFANHLLELIAVMITVDENEWRWLFLLQTPVAGENQTRFGPRRADQAVTGEMLAVNHVTTKHAQPLRQSAQHAIGGKLDLASGHGACQFGFRH